MTHNNQPFLSETHLSTHSTALPTKHGTFNPDLSIHVPDLPNTPQPITTTDRSSQLQPTTFGTAPTTTPKHIKVPPSNQGIMDLISRNRGSRNILGSITTRFSTIN